MAIILRDRKIETDTWQRLEAGADGRLPAVPMLGDVIVPLAVWAEQRVALLARPGRVGVSLNGDDDPAAIADDLRHFGVVAVNFPKFSDGRGYSVARLLRERYGYRGELRATGDIFRDHLFFLAGCGFDAFALREGENPQEALAGFGVFSDAYQNSVERPVPLFRRRDPAAADGVKYA